MEVIIQGTISALGYLEDGVYYQEPDCYETIRDLIRFLRNDSNTLLARKICGERNIIESDLIPIIKSDDLKDKMFDITLRLLANLTQPAIVSLQGKQPEDREEWQTFWRLEENLRRAKAAFADVKFFTVLKQKLEKYFNETEWEDRFEEDRLVMERIVVLLRYIFSISPTDKDGKVSDLRTTTESSSHDRLILAFLESGIDEVLIHVASQSKERDFHLSILVIFALIVKEHSPDDIATAGRDRTVTEREKAEEELRQTVEIERAKLEAQRRKILASRHSRFSGSYVVKGMSAVNKEKDLVIVKPIKDVNEFKFFDERKAKKRIAKNRRPFEAQERTHLSSMELRIKLKKFVEDILSKCFNRLLKSTKELAFDTRLSAGQRNADIHFFLLMAFMLKYSRLAKRTSSDVSVCLHVEAFHHIQVHLDNYLESVATVRKEAKHYGTRAQYALTAYKELILFHQHLLDTGSAEEKHQAQKTCEHILVVEEYREMGVTLMRKYMPGVLSKTFLRDLVLSIHYYFRLLERSVKSGNLNTVKKRSKVRRRRTKKSADFAPEPLPAVVDSMSTEDLDRKWLHINEELNGVILGNIEMSSDQIPINSLLDVDEELHQKFAMLKVQRAMREGRPADAMGLYRASRAMWLSDGIFGTPDMDAEKEMSELQEIFFADLKEVADQLLNAEIAAQKRFTANSMVDEGDEEDYSDEDEEIEPKYETKEINFDFDEYVGKYAKTEVLRWYVFLLNDFATNSVELNKALVKLLHRVAFDLKMPSRLFQLSLFRIFAQIRTHFNNIAKEDMKKSRLFELYTFGHHLLKRFFASFDTLGDKLAPEILFWKGAKECYEIENGYGTYDESKKHTKEDGAWTWSEDLEDELRSLYNEYRDMDERPEGMDVLDFIEPNLSRPRTRKQIFSKLKEFGLDPLGAKANKGSILDRNFPIIQMKQLIEEYNAKENKENEDLVNFIKTRLVETHGEFSRPKIIKQMNYLGIDYEKKRKPTSKRYKEWTEGLRTELTALKQQYEELDAEDHELIDLVEYVMRRLSEKKPRRQVERELEALGAVIERREKPRKAKEKPSRNETNEYGEDEQNPGSYHSESSDAELELEELSDEDQGEASKPSSIVREIITPSIGEVNVQSVIESTSRNVNLLYNYPLDEGGNQNMVDDSPIKSTKKRKRVLASSDEEDSDIPVEVQNENVSVKSPTVLTKKKHRVVLSDSDED